MKIAEDSWLHLATLLKSRLLAKYDPGALIPDDGEIASRLEFQHRGFYISVYDSGGGKIARTGFFREGCTNVLHSAMQALAGLHSELEAKGISSKALPTSSYNFAAVWDLIFIENPLAWDVNVDGIYLTWGDKYKGLYLPCEIKRMSVTKPVILDRLCSFKLGIPANLWRLPECLSYRILADSYSI